MQPQLRLKAPKMERRQGAPAEQAPTRSPGSATPATSSLGPSMVRRSSRSSAHRKPQSRAGVNQTTGSTSAADTSTEYSKLDLENTGTTLHQLPEETLESGKKLLQEMGVDLPEHLMHLAIARAAVREGKGGRQKGPDPRDNPGIGPKRAQRIAANRAAAARSKLKAKLKRVVAQLQAGQTKEQRQEAKGKGQSKPQQAKHVATELLASNNQRQGQATTDKRQRKQQQAREEQLLAAEDGDELARVLREKEADAVALEAENACLEVVVAALSSRTRAASETALSTGLEQGSAGGAGLLTATGGGAGYASEASCGGPAPAHLQLQRQLLQQVEAGPVSMEGVVSELTPGTACSSSQPLLLPHPVFAGELLHSGFIQQPPPGQAAGAELAGAPVFPAAARDVPASPSLLCSPLLVSPKLLAGAAGGLQLSPSAMFRTDSMWSRSSSSTFSDPAGLPAAAALAQYARQQEQGPAVTTDAPTAEEAAAAAALAGLSGWISPDPQGLQQLPPQAEAGDMLSPYPPPSSAQPVTAWRPGYLSLSVANGGPAAAAGMVGAAAAWGGGCVDHGGRGGARAEEFCQEHCLLDVPFGSSAFPASMPMVWPAFGGSGADDSGLGYQPLGMLN